MSRLLLAILAVGLVAEVAVADVPPPPPPKGKKYVSVTSEVVLGKEVTGYVFVQQVGTGFGRPMYTYSKVELSAEKALALPAGGRRTFVSLVAVPQDAAKEFKTDAELFDAVGANKVKGAHRVGFSSTATVSETVKGDSVKWKYTITGIDDKGVKTKVEGDGYEPPADKPKKDKAPAPTGTVVAGIAAFAALLLGGFWLAGRARRKV
jgi:hypothetical protein